MALHCQLDCFIPSNHLFMKKDIIVAFDFDGTVTRKDTLLEFIRFSKGAWRFYVGFLMFSPWLLAMKLRMYPNWKVKQRLFSFFFKGVPINQFNTWGKAFCGEIDKIVRHETLEAIKSHQENGSKIIIISASVENWILPWAEQAGIDTVLATKIEVDENSLLTGKFSSKNCYGQVKVNRLLAAFPNRNDYQLIAYGDSRGDKELIEYADCSYFLKAWVQDKKAKPSFDSSNTVF